MLDKDTSAILDYVNRECADGGYKVIEINEILDKLPSRLRLDSEGIKNNLRFLSDREYINIKYSDDNVFCLCALPKGKLYTEEQTVTKQDDSIKFKRFMISSFFGAMVGSMIGSAVVAIITSLL